jgi:hypothetical protein
MSDSGASLAPSEGERIIRLVAHHVGAEAHGRAPRVSAELPEGRERFEGLLPPVVTASSFAIRKPAIKVFTLTDYANAGIMNNEAALALSGAVVDRLNILVAGGTGTGKTTLANALLADIAHTNDRIVLIEDTCELQCQAPNLVALRGKDGVATIADLVRSSLRLRPDRPPDRRGARRRGPRPAQGLGHRPSRRHRHHPRRKRGRRAAPHGTADRGGRGDSAARAHRRDHQFHRCAGARRLRPPPRRTGPRGPALRDLAAERPPDIGGDRPFNLSPQIMRRIHACESRDLCRPFPRSGANRSRQPLEAPGRLGAQFGSRERKYPGSCPDDAPKTKAFLPLSLLLQPRQASPNIWWSKKRCLFLRTGLLGNSHEGRGCVGRHQFALKAVIAQGKSFATDLNQPGSFGIALKSSLGDQIKSDEKGRRFGACHARRLEQVRNDSPRALVGNIDKRLQRQPCRLHDPATILVLPPVIEKRKQNAHLIDRCRVSGQHRGRHAGCV